jgi:hypothetical protein
VLNFSTVVNPFPVILEQRVTIFGKKGQGGPATERGHLEAWRARVLSHF